MHRRTFLGTAAASVGVVAGLARLDAQGRQAAPGQAQGRAGGAGRLGGPAQVSAEKLARVSLMTLCFDDTLKTPWTATPTPEQTLTIFDLPKMYVETYGVHNIEYQHRHLAAPDASVGPIDGDPAIFRELKARLDEQKVQMTQINLEFADQNISTTDAAKRQMAIDRTKKWIDNAVLLGCPRVMINQQQAELNKDTRAHAVAAWKQMVDFGKTKGVKVSAETRGLVGQTRDQLGMLPWEFLAGVIKDAGAYSNVDIGNAAAATQEELNRAIKGLFATSSGNMHIKSSPAWDVGTTVRYTESLGYKGLYSVEVRTHPAVRIIYNTILANLA